MYRFEIAPELKHRAELTPGLVIQPDLPPLFHPSFQRPQRGSALVARIGVEMAF